MPKDKGIQSGRRNTKLAVPALFVIFAGLACARLAAAQSTTHFQQVFQFAPTQPLFLDVDVPIADLEILYSHDGEVRLNGTAQASSSTKLDDRFFKSVLSVELTATHFTVRHVPDPAYPENAIKVRYRIDVPYRTQVTSKVGRGRQTISGIMGPVSAITTKGDIEVSYVSKGLQIQDGDGDISLQVIGEHADARTGAGNIICERIPQGVSAEAGEGNITLMVVGPSSATVRRGTGRIDVGGARGSFKGKTDQGDLHIKAIPRDRWQLQSVAGNIRLELPFKAGFDLDASTDSGEFQVDRGDFTKPASGSRRLHQDVNGGGMLIDVRTVSGNIAIR
jgi:hypothetical protein